MSLARHRQLYLPFVNFCQWSQSMSFWFRNNVPTLTPKTWSFSQTQTHKIALHWPYSLSCHSPDIASSIYLLLIYVSGRNQWHFDLDTVFPPWHLIFLKHRPIKLHFTGPTHCHVTRQTSPALSTFCEYQYACYYNKDMPLSNQVVSCKTSSFR